MRVNFQKSEEHKIDFFLNELSRIFLEDILKSDFSSHRRLNIFENGYIRCASKFAEQQRIEII